MNETGSVITENSSEPNVSNSDSKEFMIAQYAALSDSFWRNEELGERRVNFLIALVTAVTGALVTLAGVQGRKLEDLLLPSIPAATVLLLLGAVTWRRMLKRNLVTDEYKRAMNLVRRWFEADNPQLEAYRPFPYSLLFSIDYKKFAAEFPKKGKLCELNSDLIDKFDSCEQQLGAKPKICGIKDGQKWLVYSDWDRDEDSEEQLIRREGQYLIKNVNDKSLVVYKPRKLSGGGLAEMVSVMNSVFVGALLAALLVLVLPEQIQVGKAPISINCDPLWCALIIWFVGIIGAIIVQRQWMIKFYEDYDIFVPQGDSPSNGNSSHPPTGK